MFTFQHDLAEDWRVPVQRATVPAVSPELVLAFLDPHFDPLTETDHDPRVAST